MQIHNSPDITLGWLASEALTLVLPALGPGRATRVARKCLGAMWVVPGSWVVTCSGKVTAGIWKYALLLLIHVTMRAGIDPCLASKSSYFRGGAAESLGFVWPKGGHMITHPRLCPGRPFLWQGRQGWCPPGLLDCRSWWVSQFHVTVLSQADPEVRPGLKADTNAWSPDVPPSLLSSSM